MAAIPVIGGPGEAVGSRAPGCASVRADVGDGVGGVALVAAFPFLSSPSLLRLSSPRFLGRSRPR
jgi:hypothetical protein